MNLKPLLVIAALLSPTYAAAATTSGQGALALAAVVADHSLTLTLAQKQRTAQTFNGNVPNAPAGYKITVRADSVTCQVSNVDLTSRSCDLLFGAHSVLLQGRKANELFATIRANGVPPQGTAGSTYESVSHLSCTLDLDQLRMHDGGGASCVYQ